MSKKMVLAILEDADSGPVMQALLNAGHPTTLIDSTGGFLRQGKTTLIAGVDEELIESVIELLHKACQPSANPFQKKATVMVLDVDHFEQIP